MSVTVADILKLPSLRQAKVLAGHRGLTKIVSSISVLESIDPGVLVDAVFPQGEYYGSEIVITGFLNSKDDVDLQCANMRRLAEGGEVGIILYYVGIYLPKVDQRLIDIANEKDFVLICMPEKQHNLRYSDVISDVMESIYQDKARTNSVVSDILARMSALPPPYQSINSALKILCEHASCSAALRDEAGHILNLVVWPHGLESIMIEGIKQEIIFPEGENYIPCPFLPDCQIYRQSIQPDSGQRMELLLIKEGRSLSESFLEQAVDVTRICINIWGRRHGEVAIHELIRAILQDEPMKMRRLADIFQIDVAAIHDMWVLEGALEDSPRRLQSKLESCREIARGCASAVFADMYENRLLIFLSTPESYREAERAMEAILEEVRQVDETVTEVCCGRHRDTAEVRSAYLAMQEYLQDAKKIYPLRQRFHIGDILFAKECRQLIERGERAIAECSELLAPLQSDNEEQNLRSTLCVYLLDSDFGVTKTASLLYLHKNTVKYRIQKISDLLGYHPDRMPQAMRYYQAAAVHRLLQA